MYNLQLELIISRGGKRFSGGALWWEGLKADGFAGVTAVAQDAENTIAELAKGNGPLTVTIVPTVIASTGPSPDVRARVFHGIAESDLQAGYRAFMGIAEKLIALGDHRVEAKGLA